MSCSKPGAEWLPCDLRRMYLKLKSVLQKLYDDLPERLKIFHGDEGSSFSLLADSEPGLNELIDSLRTTWKNQNGTELEVNNSTTDGETAMDVTN